MLQRIIKKRYYRIRFTLKSPLAVGSGDSIQTDRDLIRDSFGRPYIPAAAIAGVTRNLLKDEAGIDDYFGEKTDTKESRLIFYDAQIHPAKKQKDTDSMLKYTVSVRDSVRLDEYKTAIDGCKFDMEVLEPGIEFETYIEQNYYDDSDLDFAGKAANLFLEEEVVFGAKSTRGYGRIGEVSVLWTDFIFAPKDKETAGAPKQQSGLEEWLTFSVYDADFWEKSKEIHTLSKQETDRNPVYRKLSLTLRLTGAISIRKYTTKVRKDMYLPQPDYEQLTIDDGKPVIPGSTWAGAILHRMMELGLSEEDKKILFGYVSGENRKARSRLRFCESVIDGAKEKILSRNALDRFTGGTVKGALFTEKTFYGGLTDLAIEMEKRHTMTERQCEILAAALTDLNYGFLAVGGETAIGRGIFSAEKINGKTVQSQDDFYSQMLAQIKEVFAE